MRKYGLTRLQVAELRAAQGDECAICGDAGPEHLDHDHESGLVRSLLCQRCNFGLGLFRDHPDLLRAAADYVERHALGREPGEDHGADGDAAVAAPARSSSRPISPGYARWLAMTAG